MTTAPALKPSVRSAFCRRQQRSTSSPAASKRSSKPPTSSSDVFAEGHVAAGDVLGLAVGDEDVDRPPRRGGDAFGEEAVVLGRDVGAADAGVAVGAQQGGDVVQPVGVGIGVVVEEGDDLAAGGFDPLVARVAEAAVLGLDQDRPVAAGDLGRGVAGAVVDDDHLVVGVGEVAEPRQALVEGALAVVGADDDRDRRPGAAAAANGTAA